MCGNLRDLNVLNTPVGSRAIYGVLITEKDEAYLVTCIYPKAGLESKTF